MMTWCVSEVKEVPHSIATQRALQGPRQRRPVFDGTWTCSILGHSIPTFLVNTRHSVAIGKHEATYNVSCVKESVCQQLFSLTNKTGSQPLKGDKCLSRKVKKRSWWGFKQQDGNFELNPLIIAYRVHCFSYWKSWGRKAIRYFGIKLICQNCSFDDTVD